MKRALKMTLIAAGVAALGSAKHAFAYEEMYRPTPVGTVELRELPARHALAATGEGSYFERDDAMFMTLFRYIQRHDIAMTVPVEAEIDNAEMRFFVGADRAESAIPSEENVAVVAMPSRQVIAVGLRGAYTEETFTRGREQLRAWLAKNPQYVEAGPPYAVYWSGPYVPSFLKRSEVHVPISRTGP